MEHNAANRYLGRPLASFRSLLASACSVLGFSAILSAAGCELFGLSSDEGCEVRPFLHACEPDRPTLGRLEVSVTVDAEFPRVPISIYRDDFELGDLVLSDTAATDEAEYTLPMGEYSATATYISGQDTVVAVDGDEITTALVIYCDGRCWEVYNADLNLELSR